MMNTWVEVDEFSHPFNTSDISPKFIPGDEDDDNNYDNDNDGDDEDDDVMLILKDLYCQICHFIGTLLCTLERDWP